MVKHIMLMKFIENDDTPDNIEQIKDDLLSISNEVSGLINAEVGYNFGEADYDLVYTASFKNPAALKHFNISPEYIKIKNYIQSVCEDSNTIDYMLEADNTVEKDSICTEKKPVQKKNDTVDSKIEDVAEDVIKVSDITNTQPEIKNIAPATTMVKDISDDNYTPHNITPMRVIEIEDDTPVAPVSNIQAVPASSPAPVSNIQAGANVSAASDDIVVKRIEPKGTSIKDGESAMVEAWKCPTCGKINGNFVGLCGCGASKPTFYTPMTPEEVEYARSLEAPKIESEDLPIISVDNAMITGDILPPTMDDYVNTIKPTITKTVNAIRKSAGDDFYYSADEKETANEPTVAQRAAANIEEEQLVEVKHIEPKGKQIKDGESAMDDAWRCPICSKINGGFVGICGCGAHRPEEYTPVPLSEITTEDGRPAYTTPSSDIKVSAVQQTIDSYEQMINSKKNNTFKNISDTFNSVKNKGMQTITDAMNNSELATNVDTSSVKKKKSKKEVGYNSKLLSGDDSQDFVTLKRIEPKGSVPNDGQSAMSNSWLCPQCGKTNASYIGKCGCGCEKTSA